MIILGDPVAYASFISLASEGILPWFFPMSSFKNLYKFINLIDTTNIGITGSYQTWNSNMIAAHLLFLESWGVSSLLYSMWIQIPSSQEIPPN